jgi:hypothetical protein
MMKPENLNKAVCFNYRIVKGGASALPIIDSLYSQLNLSNKRYLEERKIRALNNILSNLLNAYYNNQSLVISRRCEDYSFPKKFYGMEHYGYNIIIPLLNSLKEHEYIEEKLGYFNYNTGSGYRTRIWAALKLLELYFQILPNETLQYKTPIILKDADKNFIEYDKSETFIKKMIMFADEYNEFISSFEIAVSDKWGKKLTQKSDAFFDPPSIINNHNNISELQTQINNASIPLLEGSLNENLDCRLHRVFNESKFNIGGRWYGADYQGYNQEKRSFITINGNKTSEIDFKGLHLNMLYNFEGIDFQGDPYSIANNNPELRPILKKVSLIGINALTPISAVKALNEEIRTDSKLFQIKEKYNLKPKELFAQFENAHPQISKYFRSGYGIKLQYLDSKIAEEILKHFTRQGKPCLCIHDSFIVEESNKEELTEVMKESYNNYLGFPGKVEVKF